jgi:hypothetical protein
LETLKGDGIIRETLEISGSGIVWQAEVAQGVEKDSSLTYDGATLRMFLSKSDITRLANTDDEGIYFKKSDFRYYLEKDFPCVHPRAAEAEEPQTPTFSSPTRISI